MIRVEVEEYCQNCLDFNPDVTKPQRVIAPMTEEPLHLGNTVIRCSYRNRCASIKRYLERQSKGDVN